MALCECGCGGEASPGMRFISGHNSSVDNPNKGGKRSEETKQKAKETKRLNKLLREGKIELPFCACGCGGRVTKLGNKYITGHNSRVNHPMSGKHHTEKTKQKLREDHLGKQLTEEHKQKMRDSSPHLSGENNGMYGKESPVKGLTKETSERLRMAGEKISKTLKVFYATEEGKLSAKDHSLKMCKIMCEKWQDPEFVKIITDSWNKKPTQPEKETGSIVQNLIPNEYKYNGNFNLGITIGGKIPDFVNVNGKKKAIDLFGDYWHEGEDPQVRIDLFKKYGWELLVIWEHELKDKDAVIQKILKFHGVKSDYVLMQKTLDRWIDDKDKNEKRKR